MKISCLIAAYKAGNYIGKALESIRGQEHVDWEVVVVEDGSRDQTEEIVRRFANSVSQPVRYDNFGVNRGVATARNRLLELAEGEAGAFLDADDWWTPRHLLNASNALANETDLVVSRIQLFDLDSGQPLETYSPPPELFRDPGRTLFERSAIMTSSCVTLRLSTARQIGGFDHAFRIGEDRDYWLRFASKGGRFADSGEETCFYAKHAGSTMAKTQLWAQQEVAFYEKHKEWTGISLALRRKQLARVLVNYGRLIRASDPSASLQALGKAWKLRPLSLSIALHFGTSWITKAPCDRRKNGLH